MSGRIRSLSGIRHQLYRMITCDRAAVGSGHQKPYCKHYSPRPDAILLQHTFSCFSTEGSQKPTPAEMSDLAANQERFSSAASSEAQGYDLPTWAMRCQTASALARSSCVWGNGVIAILQYSRTGFGTALMALTLSEFVCLDIQTPIGLVPIFLEEEVYK